MKIFDRTKNIVTTKLLVAILSLSFAPSLFARSIYLNGTDISSARNQSLKNVHLRVDENGNIYIEAPQYQVNEENTFTPLSSWVHGSPMLKHTPPQPLPNTVPSAVEQAPSVPSLDQNRDQGAIVPPNTPSGNTSAIDKPASQLQDKEGTKVGG